MWTPTKIESRSATLDLSASAQGRRTVRQVICDDVTVCNATDHTDWSIDPIQMELCEACLIEGCGSGGRVVIRRFADRILIIPDFKGMTQGEWEEYEYEPPRWLINKGPLSFSASDWVVFQKASIDAPSFGSIPQASTADVLRLYHFLAPRSFLPNYLSPSQAIWDLILCTNGHESELDLKYLRLLFIDPSSFEGHEFCTPTPESYIISAFLDTPTMSEWPIFSSESNPSIRLSDDLFFRPILKC